MVSSDEVSAKALSKTVSADEVISTMGNSPLKQEDHFLAVVDDACSRAAKLGIENVSSVVGMVIKEMLGTRLKKVEDQEPPNFFDSAIGYRHGGPTIKRYLFH